MDPTIRKDPFFSIIMPIFKLEEKLLRRSTSSILLQEFPNWEAIIVLDGACPDFDRIKDITDDQRFRAFISEHQGVSAARNLGIKEARGHYLCFLDGDDEYSVNHLQILYDTILSLPDQVCLLRTGMIHHFQEKNIYTGLYLPNQWMSPQHFFLSNFFGIISLCMHSSIARSNLFDSTLKYLEDTDFVLCILNAYPFHQIMQYTTNAYAHQNQSTQLMYEDEHYQENIDNAILALTTIKEKGGQRLIKQLPDGFYRKLLAEKYLQYANGLLINRHPAASWLIFQKSFFTLLRSGKWWPALKYFIKYPWYRIIS